MQLPQFLHRFMPWARNQMIIDQTGRLHEGIADSRPDKLETEFFQRLAHGKRFIGTRRNRLHCLEIVLFRFIVDKRPDEFIKWRTAFL